MSFSSERERRRFGCRGRRHNRVHSPGYQFAVAIALIAFGALLFLDNVGLLPIARLYAWWPLIPIALGVSKLMSRPTIVGALWAAFFIAVGSVILMVNLNLLHIRGDGNATLSLLFITFGFAALIKTVDKRSMTAKQAQSQTSSFLPPGSTDAPFGSTEVPFGNSAPPFGVTDVITESVVLSSVKRRIESTNFRGGTIHNVLGSACIDLRAAQMPFGIRSATIEVDCVMGEVKIRIPDTWRVRLDAQAMAANVEDKTVHPATLKPEDAPTLILTGHMVMSNVELKN